MAPFAGKRRSPHHEGLPQSPCTRPRPPGSLVLLGARAAGLRPCCLTSQPKHPSTSRPGLSVCVTVAQLPARAHSPAPHHTEAPASANASRRLVVFAGLGLIVLGLAAWATLARRSSAPPSFVLVSRLDVVQKTDLIQKLKVATSEPGNRPSCHLVIVAERPWGQRTLAAVSHA